MTQNSRRPDPYLFVVEAWNGVAIQTLRFSTHTISTRGTDTPANTVYDGRIIDPGKFSQTLFESAGAVSGRASVNVGYVEVANPDGQLDALVGYGWGREFTLRRLPTRDSPVATSTLLLRGIVDGVETSNAMRTLRFRVRDRLAALDVPLLTDKYLGTTLTAGATAEGDAELKDQIKSYAWGVNREVPGKIANRFNLLYQFAANAQNLMTVYEGGLPLPGVGDAGSLSALIVLPLNAGQCATCLALGIARLGSTPQRGITADLIEGATAALRTAAQVTGRILDYAGQPSAERSASSFAAADSFNSAEVGILVDSEATTLQVLSDVGSSIGAIPGPDAEGVLRLVTVGEPSSTVVATYTMRDLLASGFSMQLFAGPSSEGEGIPAWGAAVEWGRVWRVQGDGDLYGAVSTERRTYLASAFRRAETTDSTILTGWPHATRLEWQALLTTQAAGVAEAARRLALHKVRRDRLHFPVPMSRAVGIVPGQSVKVKMPRFYEDGKNFLIIGREDDWKRNVAILTLWG